MKRRMSDPNIVYAPPTPKPRDTAYNTMLAAARKSGLKTLRGVSLVFGVSHREDGKYTQFIVTILPGILDAVMYVFSSPEEGSISENSLFHAQITYDVHNRDSFKEHINSLEAGLGDIKSMEIPERKQAYHSSEEALRV